MKKITLNSKKQKNHILMALTLVLVELFRRIFGVLNKQIARCKAFAVYLLIVLAFVHYLGRTVQVNKLEGTTFGWRETKTKNGANVTFGRIRDNTFLQAQYGFVDKLQRQTPLNSLAVVNDLSWWRCFVLVYDLIKSRVNLSIATFYARFVQINTFAGFSTCKKY